MKTQASSDRSTSYIYIYLNRINILNTRDLYEVVEVTNHYTGRTIDYRISNCPLSTSFLEIYGYRRIGVND